MTERTADAVANPRVRLPQHATESLVQLHDALRDLTPEQRLEVFHDISEGYCGHCGYEDPEGRCQCWNDE